MSELVEHDISNEEQLRLWVAGKSLHRRVEGLEGGECCPDFSCCQPDLLQPREVRAAFVIANERERTRWLGVFLEAAIRDATQVKVYVARPRDED